MDSAPSVRPQANDLLRRCARAERLVEGMQKIFNHDLSNQLVVIQGLLQLLSLEEGDRLSADGCEYVQRLTGAAEKAQDMVRALKNIGRIGSVHEKIERLALADVIEEVKAEVNPLFPGTALEYHCDWRVPEVRAGRQSLQQALVGLLRLCTAAAAPRSAVYLVSRQTSDASEIRVWGTAAVEQSQRAELLYVRELADTWGGDLRVEPDPEHGTAYTLLFPGT